METVKSSLGSRPISGRPLTSGRDILNTGLIAPKSSRGRTALRRQVQDKSYFVGLLRSKVNEINNEKNVLLRESDIMSKEEARISVYRQKAETLAKELNELNLELLTYNEFLERSRIGDNVTVIKEDINEVKHENDALIANLESDFSQLKNLENVVKKNNENLHSAAQNFHTIKSQFNDQQRATFNELHNYNLELSKGCRELENEINLWRNRKAEIEDLTGKENNIVKLEMLHSIGKLRQLESQKNDLLHADSNEEDERATLLAQVKRDNNYITSLEDQIEERRKTLENVINEIHFYKDSDKQYNLGDFKLKEKLFDEFMNTFQEDLQTTLMKSESINNEINDLTNRLARSGKYLSILKQISDVSTSAYNIVNELIIQKRKLELDVNKNNQVKAKADKDKELLGGKIDKLQESIDSYSDISKLKAQIENKLVQVKQHAERTKQELEQTILKNQTLASETRDLQLELKEQKRYNELTELEKNLRAIVSHNHNLHINDSKQMIVELKALVLEKAKTYNQSLMGF